MGTRGKIVDVIHHLSPKVPIIFLGNYALDTEFHKNMVQGGPQTNNRVNFDSFTSCFGDFWRQMGLMETFGD